MIDLTKWAILITLATCSFLLGAWIVITVIRMFVTNPVTQGLGGVM